MDSAIIQKYFQLTKTQEWQFASLFSLYQAWNDKINVISRKDLDALYLHHVLHSLSIVKCYQFVPGAEILDLGTGGGFPGIPLAILHPDISFHLIDGTAKKLKVVQQVADGIGLKNVTIRHIRAEEYKFRFDMVVSRAVARSDKLLGWSRPLLKRSHQHAFPNGLITLKGGAIHDEMAELDRHEYFEINPIEDIFEETYFKEKYVVYIQG